MDRTWRRWAVCLVLLALAGALVGPAAGGGKATDAPAAAQATHDYVIVKLADAPTASYMGEIPGLQRTKPLRGQKLNLNSTAARAYGRHLAERRQSARGWFQSNAPRAQVVREYSAVFNGLAVKLNGERLETLAQAPGVVAASPSALYRPAMTVSVGLINATGVWPSLGGRADAGSGIKVGIIDTGIREDHAAFDCKGAIEHDVFASGEALPPNNRRVIVFNHGTHVAGTVAGCIVDLNGPEGGATEGTWSGVAPGATLHDYNVFPGFGAGYRAFDGSAFSHDIAAALEKAVADGMDVVNLSIGGKVQGPHDLLAEALDATVNAGVVAAVAAGNSGPGDSTVESPGTAPGALTAGASTNPHFVGIPVAVSGKGTFGAALGDFENFDPAITAAYTVTTPANGCSAITNAVAGKIALIDRGVCSFSAKIRNAQNAGAVGALIVNNVAGDPVGMSQDGTPNQPTIPAAMLGKSEGASIKPSGTATVDGTTQTEFLTTNADIIAGFSSRGPTPFTYLVKPDATAPGVNVVSSVFDEMTGDLGWAYFQGTSMATPHMAGAAALLLDQHPGWSPADVKSALVNTAQRVVTDHVNAAVDPGVLARGGGRIDLLEAFGTSVVLDPVSVSFGLWKGNVVVAGRAAITVRNTSAAAQSCSAGASGPGIVSVSPSGFSVPANGTNSVAVALSAGRGTGSGDYSGDVTITCGGDALRAPWWVRIDRLAKP